MVNPKKNDLSKKGDLMAEYNFRKLIDTTQTLDTMLHQILNQALVFIESEAGSLMIVDNKRGILQIKARLGTPRAGRNTEPIYKIEDNSIASWVVRNKRSYICPDVSEDDNFEPSRSGKNFSSLISVPVLYKNMVLAVINSDSIKTNQFKEEQKEKLEIVAKQIALPIAERMSVLTALSEVGVELSRLPKEAGVEPVLKKIAELAVRSLGADIVTIYPYIQKKDEFPVKGKGPTYAGKIRFPDYMNREVYKGDVPRTVVEKRKCGFHSVVRKEEFLADKVERPNQEDRPRFIERECVKSMASLLLPSRAEDDREEEIIGVMFVNYRSYHDFNIDEISALQTLADYAAIAISNARREIKRNEEQIKMVESISANFAHRIGNLAGTSRVAANLLREKINKSDKFSQKHIDRIDSKSKVLFELAERLLRPFKKTGRMFDISPTDAKKIINEEVEKLKNHNDKITIVCNFPNKFPKVNNVDFQLREVINDLINNSIEAIPQERGGKIEINVEHDKTTNKLIIDISDNGKGIDKNIQDELFTPGITTKKSLGIGLWWSQTFLKATGGNLFLKNTLLDKGTIFTIEIPCVDIHHDNDENIRECDVLVVDDMEDWRNIIIDLIEQEGYKIKSANNYSEAKDLLSSNHFKLAIIDQRLKDSDPNNNDGMRLLNDINRDFDTKVIIISSYSDEHDIESAEKKKNFLKFIRKQEFDPFEFRSIIKKVIKS